MKLDDAKVLANFELQKHGLIEKGWTFNFDRGSRRFGCCYYATRRITLSWLLTEANGAAEVRNTILHEVAHALAGHPAGHGPEWVRICRSIGGDGLRCYSTATVNTVPRRVTVQF